MNDDSTPVAPRAEELIVSAFSQKQELSARGIAPTRVILTPLQYRLLQDYRARLGEAPSTDYEYLTQYDLFGMEFYVESSVRGDDLNTVRVE
jgi:hypothetical protein